MDKIKKLFNKDIQVPDVVINATEIAFKQIKSEGEVRSMKFNKKKVFVAACIATLVLGSISVGAAAHYFNGKAMEKTLHVSKDSSKELVEKGMVEDNETINLNEMAQTSNGVTVTPKDIISDGKVAWITFEIKGFDIADGEVPDFKEMTAYEGDKKEQSNINAYSKMYDGTVSNEYGEVVYEDGTPVKDDETRNYKNEEGNFEAILVMHVNDVKKSIAGATIHVEYKNLGIMSGAKYTNKIKGKWKFDIKLPKASEAKKFKINKKIGGGNLNVEEVSISPISIVTRYSNDEATEYAIPQFKGVILKDGTELPYLGDAGKSGYANEERTEAYDMKCFERVINVNDIKTLIYYDWNGLEDYYVDLK